jgi:hypothetical protein
MSKAADRGRDLPALVPFQPEPIALHIAKDYHSDGCTTALVRVWLNGDAEHCRLCPLGRCTAYAGVCLVQVRMDVPDDQARMFSTHGLRWTPARGGGVYVGHDDAGLVDLDRPRVVVVNVPDDVLEEHLAEPLGRAAP